MVGGVILALARDAARDNRRSRAIHRPEEGDASGTSHGDLLGVLIKGGSRLLYLYDINDPEVGRDIRCCIRLSGVGVVV